MAQFRATIKGQRGEASRLGSKQSGLTVQANGWNGGVRVRAEHNERGDRFEIYATTGSSSVNGSAYLGYVDEQGNFYASNRIAPRLNAESGPTVAMNDVHRIVGRE